MKIDGRSYVNFVGAGYLALSGRVEIRSAVSRALEASEPFARQLPAAFGAIDPIFESVEKAGSVACGTQTSVYFASGYLIGAIGLKVLDKAFDLLLLDETAHCNLKDAAKLTGLPAFEFAHCDVQSLREMLQRHVQTKQRPLVVTDGIFATSGRVAPLAQYAAELAYYDGKLFVDESHAFGVVGEHGRGAAEYCGVESLAATGATLSKAYCSQGALVGCSAAAAERVRGQTPIRGACAGSPLSAVAATASLNYVAAHPQLRRDLRATTDYLRLRLRSIGLEVIDSPAPIVSFQFGNRDDMLAMQRRLFDQGVHIQHSTYIGAGVEGMLRCAVFHDHSREDIDTLVAGLT